MSSEKAGVTAHVERQSDYEAAPEDVARALADLGRIEDALATLPRFTCNVFLAHRVYDLSYAEIADVARVSVHRVEREMARAIIEIDRALSE